MGRSTRASTILATLVPNLFLAIRIATGKPDTMLTIVARTAIT